MLQREIEKPLAWLLAIGLAFITCFVWTGNGTDPVNTPKLLALGALGFGVLGIILKFGLRQIWSNSKLFVILNLTFILFMITSTIFSNAPISQNIYGAYGRNTGLLTYLCLSMIGLGTSLLSALDSFEKLTRALIVAGIINVIYCLWVLSFGDPIPWNNTYKNILGLLGNPNFISAFLGMVASAALAYFLKPNSAIRYRFIYGLLFMVSCFLISKSHSIQGIFVTLTGGSVALFFFIRNQFKNSILQISYVVFIVLSGALAVAGMLQHGPLSFIYKKSVSLRGTYWNTGINMGQSHPLTGVGMDTYGDWYRSARPPVALIDTPGPTTLSNVAHNVVIDIFASGGFPLLLAYMGILILGMRAASQLVFVHKKYDHITVILVSTWIGYQAQSIVSINQIGLAVWGWALTGLLIAYARVSTRERPIDETAKTSRSSKIRNRESQIISPQLIIGVGLLVGGLISLPPMASDARWFVATQSNDLNTFKASLKDSFFNPVNSLRLANAAVILQNSNLLKEARDYTLQGIKFNPDYFESYLVLYGLPNSSEADKEFALANMKRLDPNNPNVLIYK